jgi:hypothetical protein
VLWYIAIAQPNAVGVKGMSEGRRWRSYAPQSAGLDGMCKMLSVSFSGAVVAPSAFGMFHAKSGECEYHVKVM